MSYYIIQYLTSPYKPDKYASLQQVEKRMILIHISNTSMALLWILTIEEKNRLVGWLVFIYVSLTNLVYIFWWIHIYFGFFKGKLLKGYNFLQNRVMGLKKKTVSIIKREKMNKKRSKEESVEYFLDEINKLKILNSLLIERIRELEIDSQDDNPINSEANFENSIFSLVRRKFDNKAKYDVEKEELGSPDRGYKSSRLIDLMIPSERINPDIIFTNSQNIQLPSDFQRGEEKNEKKNVVTKDFTKDDEKLIKFIGKLLIGKNLSDCFLLYKYQINNELFSFSNSTQNISNLIFYFSTKKKLKIR